GTPSNEQTHGMQRYRPCVTSAAPDTAATL
ncbi:MAG: hypothetical protein ACI8RC_002697, partial [Ilumatobacter sp.]